MTDIATAFPNYVPTANLTDAYIQSLITRVGWQDVTAQHPDWVSPGQYVLQDLSGNLTIYVMETARIALINAYVLMTNG
jgi:hypothetical protein